MRRALATAHPASPPSVALISRLSSKFGRLRPLLPWLGTLVFAFLLFRLLFGHLYVMRGTCECGHTEQWFEFNDRPYTIGVRLSSKQLVAGQPKHSHLYLEPSRATRY
jgi:hypothetical protein